MVIPRGRGGFPPEQEQPFEPYLMDGMSRRPITYALITLLVLRGRDPLGGERRRMPNSWGFGLIGASDVKVLRCCNCSTRSLRSRYILTLELRFEEGLEQFRGTNLRGRRRCPTPLPRESVIYQHIENSIVNSHILYIKFAYPREKGCVVRSGSRFRRKIEKRPFTCIIYFAVCSLMFVWIADGDDGIYYSLNKTIFTSGTSKLF